MQLKQHILLLSAALLLPLGGVGTAVARTIVIASPSAINGNIYSAGDTLVITDGTYTDQSINFTSTGTASRPIVLRAATPGNVLLSGRSSLSISGSYLEVHGLRFKGGYSTAGNAVVQFRTNSSTLANNCRLTECSIENYNPSDASTDYKWVSLYGRNNCVDHCYFVNKAHMGTLMVAWLVAGDKQEVRHEISNNYFGYRTALLDNNEQELNGQEIIRLGDSNTSLQSAACIVHHNYFERTNGEIEIISNKSCGNLFRNNLFYECRGMLTLRHGNRCTVDGNWFIGNNLPNTGGVRIIGEEHTIINNYMSQLGGSGYRSALCIVRGEANNALNGYAQVKEAKILFNTIINCKSAIEMSYGSGSTQTLSPTNSIVAHNVARQNMSNNTLKVHQSTPSIEWVNNIFYGGNINSSNRPNTGITTSIDPLFINHIANGYPILIPSTPSPLENERASSLYPEVTTDIWRTTRPSTPLPGAMEPNPNKLETPPSALTTGPIWMREPALSVQHPIAPNASLRYIQHSHRIVSTTPITQLSVYSPDGHLVTTSSTPPFSLKALTPGLYIAVGISNQQTLTTTFIVQ